LRGYLPAFSSNLVASGGNPNPAGEIDGRLANWYTVLNTMLAGNAPYVSWPLPPASVPVCTLSTQPQITSFTAPVLPNNDNVFATWTSVNTTSCTLTTLYAFNGYSFTGLGPASTGFDIYYIISASPYQASAPPFTTPGWGTDTYTLTCYNGYLQPATESLLNTSGFTASTPTPLAIATFVTDGNGDLGWTTANSNPNTTTCTITDEFGGQPYYQSPIGQLPANNPLVFTEGEGSFPTGGPYPYFYNGSAFCPGEEESENPVFSTDTITLTCSDKYNGTAFSTLTLYNPCNSD